MYSLLFAHISMFNFDPARFHSLIYVPCGLIVPCAANPIKFCNLTGLGRIPLRARSQCLVDSVTVSYGLSRSYLTFTVLVAENLPK